ncbi:MAG: winged helix-turn-helix transcriptional regulator [Methanobrevibacter sp.]|uniref:MarR family winged helix-turn-helix transcriptional regulator n=1 Tax=Methanobrevibacter sp. TaxID=66852 RepID=UPI0025FD61F1|nr:MarR family winged helix-turn-helix transcriptional regulator [Methanobrevibacter sp.]MBQ8018336.1 winged helix-turn-helix transcriptional regulator [Methanobrevibacter sp.]MBR1610604.1 winged helix-turn-helix transcriptional regulator [Methanobrevibacter sp.]
MDDWENDRILLTPTNLYMEYILLSYNNFLRQKLDDVKITYGELTYIYNIKFFPSISQRKLAETLFVSEANVAKMVKKLVEKGLVEKQKDKANKSRNILKLTEKGEEVFVKINVITCGWERNITKNMSNEEYFKFKQTLYEITKESTDL